MFTAALFIIAIIRKEPGCLSMEEWKNYTMEYDTALKRDDFTNFAGK